MPLSDRLGACSRCGADLREDVRVPVETLRLGDLVRAVRGGPQGVVVQERVLNWITVEYPSKHHSGGKVLYKCGQDRLILVRAASDESGA